MKVIETHYGKQVLWGYNCETSIRNLAKLNGGFERHPKEYEDLCVKCDALEKKLLGLLEKLDKFEEIKGAWTIEQSDKWSAIYDKARKVLDKIDDLCIYTYPNLCWGKYSYCV